VQNTVEVACASLPASGYRRDSGISQGIVAGSGTLRQADWRPGPIEVAGAFSQYLPPELAVPAGRPAVPPATPGCAASDAHRSHIHAGKFLRPPQRSGCVSICLRLGGTARMR